MSSEREAAFKLFLQQFPALGQAPFELNKSYRADRKTDLRYREIDTPAGRLGQINGMIADFERMVNALTNEIQAEQVRSGVADPAQFNYPATAKAMIQRRDNAMRSIDVLRRASQTT